MAEDFLSKFNDLLRRKENGLDPIGSDSTIQNDKHQQMWKASQAHHDIGDESATHILLTLEEKSLLAKGDYQKTASSKFGIDGLDSIKSNWSQAVIASNPLRDSTLGTEVVRAIAPGSVEKGVFPYRGFEGQKLAECTKANPQSWSEAFRSYPKLQQYLNEQDGPRLMQALVRNELHFYDVGDRLGDAHVRTGQVSDSETLGYCQITPLAVRTFEENFPQLKQFLMGKGYNGVGHEAKALEDPTCAAMIVGAKLQSLAELYETSTDKVTGGHGVLVTNRSLAYGFNADVYFNEKSGLHPDFHAFIIPKAKVIEAARGFTKAFPTCDERVLAKSIHVQNVGRQLQYLK
jgi:hypothetical protein